MMRTVEVVFHEEVLRPSRLLALQPKGRCRAKLEERAVSNATGDPLCDWLLRVADRAEHLGVEDLAEQHDHYLYGLPKR
jgi:hypothetical protein